MIAYVLQIGGWCGDTDREAVFPPQTEGSTNS